MVYDYEQEAAFSPVYVNHRDFMRKLQDECRCSEPEYTPMMMSLMQAIREGRADEDVVVTAFREGYELGRKDAKRKISP